jgi:elongation factor G
MVLEPIVNLDVTAPADYVGDITSGLATKRARINGTDSLRGDEMIVKAQVPLAEISEYSNELKAATAGRGRYSIELSHYDAVPGNVQKQLTEAYKPRHEEE